MGNTDEPHTVENIVRFCRSCKHFPLERVKDKAGRVRKDRVAPCMWPIPVMPEGISGELTRRWMTTLNGGNCPCWESS